MPWQETAIQSLKTQGELAQGDVRVHGRVFLYNFVSVWERANETKRRQT